MEDNFKTYRKSVGLVIRKLRERYCAGSLCDFYARSGIPSSTLSRIELGENDAQLHNLDKIAKGLGLTLSEMFFYIEAELQK